MNGDLRPVLYLPVSCMPNRTVRLYPSSVLFLPLYQRDFVYMSSVSPGLGGFNTMYDLITNVILCHIHHISNSDLYVNGQISCEFI